MRGRFTGPGSPPRELHGFSSDTTELVCVVLVILSGLVQFVNTSFLSLLFAVLLLIFYLHYRHPVQYQGKQDKKDPTAVSRVLLM